MRRPNNVKYLLPVLWLQLSLLVPNQVSGLGFRIPNQDAEAIARGNAFVATADNPSAIYYNPAGITQLEGHQAQAGMHVLVTQNTHRSPNGTVRSKREAHMVPQFHYVYNPQQWPLAFGIGTYAPHGLGIEWPADSHLAPVAIEGRLLYATISPVVAWSVTDTLSIAAGPTISYSKVELRQAGFRFKGDDGDVGYTVGLRWQPHEQWAVGFKYLSSTEMKYRGDAAVTSFPAMGTRARVPFPQIITAGISYRPTPLWNVEFNVDWTDWDVLRTVTFETAGGDIPLPLNWKSSFLYHFGLTRYFNSGYFLSGGYFFSENSTTTRSFTPLVPDQDLHVASLGGGYKGEKWTWAVAAQLITGSPRNVQGSPGGIADGRYRWFNQGINASLGYRF